MNKKVIKYIFLGVGLYLFFAVSVLKLYNDDPNDMDWEDREAYNRKFIATLALEDNLSKIKVIELLGAPDITEAKHKESNVLQVLFYRTQHMKSDGITTKDECTPLLFKNGLLIAWGISAYEQYQGQ